MADRVIVYVKNMETAKQLEKLVKMAASVSVDVKMVETLGGRQVVTILVRSEAVLKEVETIIYSMFMFGG